MTTETGATKNATHSTEQNSYKAARQPAPSLLVYIRPLRKEEGTGFAVCSEYGTVLAAFPNYESAFFTARQFHLIPQTMQ